MRSRSTPARLRIVSLFACLVFATSPALAVKPEQPDGAGGEQAEMQGPLHAVIDRLIEAGLGGAKPAELAGDEEFLRRVYLDLSGAAPPLDEARAFLEDKSPSKRAELIDRLLADPRFARNMQYVFDRMLMERRGGNSVKDEAWKDFLWQSFAENKPYDELVREILANDGTNLKQRGPAKFFLDRDADATLLVRDVGRIFLGVDLQCAQCHNHPVIPDYEQHQYYGLYTYLSRSYVITDPKLKKPVLGEKATADATFKSVFYPDETQKTGPHILNGEIVEEPAFPKGKEYYVKPDKNVRGIPKFSARERLAEDLVDPNVEAFSRNIANRLWAVMMGRGLVHPVDLHHGDNPPSHPELLDELARRFVAMDYDVKAFLRELALSRTYQRSSRLPEGVSPGEVPEDRFAVAILKPLSAEQLAWSMIEAAGLPAGTRNKIETQQQADPRLAEIYQADEKRRYQAAEEVERAVYQQFNGNVGGFVNVFGGAPGETPDAFEATAYEALYLANGGVVLSWSNSLAGRLNGKLAEPEALADELYLRVLTRHPSGAERAAVVEYLQSAEESARPEALKEIVWALMTCAEFRFNH